jgi:hypothetical protein
MGKGSASSQGKRAGHAVPELGNWRHAHAVDEATKVTLMSSLVAIVDQGNEIHFCSASKDAEGVVRSNAIASVGGVRQSMSQIEQLHRKADIAQRPWELRDKVHVKSDFSPGNRPLLGESLAKTPVRSNSCGTPKTSV